LFIFCTAGRNRTGKNLSARQILSLVCLPVSPQRHLI
jgi:hypothetical protein